MGILGFLQAPVELVLNLEDGDGSTRQFHDYYHHVARSTPSSPTTDSKHLGKWESPMAMTASAIPIFRDGDLIKGTVIVRLRPDHVQAMEHKGIRVELIGQLEVPVELGGSKPFLHQQETLSGPSKLQPNHIQRFPFDFTIPKTALESFEGHLMRIRYRLTAKILRAGLSAIFMNDSFTVSRTIWVERPGVVGGGEAAGGPPECLVGTDDGSLQVKVTLTNNDTNLYKTDQNIEGIIAFEHCRLPIVSVEMQLVRRETVQDVTESMAIHRQQVIDGLPFPKDAIPFTFFMNGNIPQISSSSPPTSSRQFAVEYSLAVVFIEAGGARSYFKQLPILLRRAPFDPAGRCLLGLDDPYTM